MRLGTKLRRRQFLQLTGAAALAGSPAASRAEDFPTRPVRIVVPYPAGIAPDIVARMVAQPLSERLGQQFIVDDRPGGASNVGTEIVAHSAPDGYTLLVVTMTNVINTSLYDNLSFDLIRDITPVAGLVKLALVLAVNPSLPVQTLPEFIAYAKANPGKINYASVGSGAATNVAGETPSEALPGVPTAAEVVPGYNAYVWDAIGAPAKTPPDIIAKLNKTINAVLAEPAIKTRLTELGGEPMIMTPAEFGKYMAEETEKWGKVVKFAHIKPD